MLPTSALGLVTILTKLVTGWWAARWAGIAVPGRLRAGTALVARGEFSIIIAGLAVAAMLPEPALGPLAAAYVLMLAILGPVLAHLANPLAELMRRPRQRRERHSADLGSNHPPDPRHDLEVAPPGIPRHPHSDDEPPAR